MIRPLPVPALAFVIMLVMIAFLNINMSTFDNPFAKPIAAASDLFGRLTGQDPDTGAVDAAGNEVFGDPSMARLGDDQLVATVNPSLNAPDFGSVDPANPSSDPLADLGGEAGFNQPSGTYGGNGLSERDQERSYNYAKRTQG